MHETAKHIVFVAGKSGGHIIPCATLAQDYKKQGYATFFFTSNGALDKKIIDSYSFLDRVIPLAIHTETGFFKNIVFVYHFVRTFIQSFKELRTIKPEKVISSGGSVALPVCFAAWVLRIPIELYELNVVPGRAIKLLSKIATTTYVCFHESKKLLPKAIYAPYPVRFTAQDVVSKTEACKQLGLDTHKKTVVVLGGSQGSQFINTLVVSWLKTIPEQYKNLQIFHQTGSKDLDTLKKAYSSLAVTAVICDYKEEMQQVYSAADIILARAGAGTLFEILFFKKKALIIPLEGASTDHQVDNAYAMMQEYPEYFKVVRQSEANATLLSQHIGV
jgi:UDP-N-acetylglucosamine--N-acetylmuramyl-(pentapeptide) pyrophosphoryl-undecaprenol N-acetylglucosamine transferase